MRTLYVARLWAMVESLTLFITTLAILSMLYRLSITTAAAFFSAAPPATAQKNPFWTGYDGGTRAWQWGGPDQSGEYYINQTQAALSTMQDAYWNGTYWVCDFERKGSGHDS